MVIKELKRTIYTDASDSNINHETKDHREDTNHYHVPVTRMHNAALHGWGIASGLQVRKSSPSQLVIEQGLAIDNEGRMIPLAAIGENAGQPGKAYINDVTVPGNLVDVPVVFATNTFANDTYYLTIELAVTQMVGPDGWTMIPVEGRVVTEGASDRIISTPLISLVPTSSFALNDTNPRYGTAIVLATVGITGGQVNTLAGNNRQQANITVGELNIEEGDQVGGGPEVGDKKRGSIGPLSSGGLKVEVPNAADNIVFQRDGDNNFDDMIVRGNHLRIKNSTDQDVMHFNAGTSTLTIGNSTNTGEVVVHNNIRSEGIVRSKDGFRPSTNDWEIARDGEDLVIREPEQSNKEWARFKDDNGLYLSGTPKLYVGASGNEGEIHVRDNAGNDTFKADGNTGKVNLKRIDPYGNELNLDARYVRIHGWDLTLDGRSGGNKRALVDADDKLIINYGPSGSGDYTKGVETPGDFNVLGKIGIGTAVPQERLHVNGKIIANGDWLQVRGAGNEMAYIGGDGWGGDIQIGSLNSDIQNLAAYNWSSGQYMNVYAKQYFLGSDKKLKKNIKKLSGSLEKISKLNGVTFDWKDKAMHELDGRQIGLIAQEVKDVLPEVVHECRNGLLSISYDSIIPLLIETVKELTKKIDDLEKELEKKIGR